jgi:hypothetical protein
MASWKYLYTQHCPPSNAINDDVDPVYRFVDDANISEKDFEPHRLKFPNKMQYQTQCEALGTSVFTDYSVMLQYQQRFPRLAKMKIAQGRIEKSDGRILFGQNKHVTWWVEMNNPSINFKVKP